MIKLLFKCSNHLKPFAIVTNKTLKVGDVVKIKGHRYYINCEPGMTTPRGKKIKHYFCLPIDPFSKEEVTNTIR